MSTTMRNRNLVSSSNITEGATNGNSAEVRKENHSAVSAKMKNYFSSKGVLSSTFD